jgi:hypothetical protein
MTYTANDKNIIVGAAAFYVAADSAEPTQPLLPVVLPLFQRLVLSRLRQVGVRLVTPMVV